MTETFAILFAVFLTVDLILDIWVLTIILKDEKEDKCS